MSDTTTNLKLISEYFVRPDIEVDESKRVHHLNPFDIRWLPFHNPQLGYLYSKPSDFTPSVYLKQLRSSLSKALVYYYPLAGRLETVLNPTNDDEHYPSCYVYVDCAKGPGVRLVHASAHDLTSSQVLSRNLDVPKVVRSFFDMGERRVNNDGHVRALFSVQVTELKDGVFLGFAANHALVDGTTFFHFQTVLSRIFMGTFSEEAVALPLVKQPDFIHGWIFKLPYIHPSEFITRSTIVETELTQRFFQFTPQSLQKIKVVANSDVVAGDNKKPISTFQSLIALVWKCITRVRNLNPDESTVCAVPINLRQRFNPPLKNDYFGNYAIKAMASAKVGDLLGNNVGWAAALLQQAVAAQDDRAARDMIIRAYKDGPEVVPQVNAPGSSNVTVAGSTRFDVSESQFGLGRLVTVRSGYVNKVDGKVNAYLGSEGDGIVDLDICLAPNTMAALLLDQQFMSFASVDLANESPGSG